MSWDLNKVLRSVEKWEAKTPLNNIGEITVEMESELFTFPKGNIKLEDVIRYAKNTGEWNSLEFMYVKQYIITAIKTKLPLQYFINALTVENNVSIFVVGCEISAFISGKSLEEVVFRVLRHEDLHAGGMEEHEIRNVLEPLRFSILDSADELMELAVH